MKILIRSLLILVGLIALAAIVLIALVFTLDPNHLKPILQKQAAERGLELRIPGDIDWKLLPNLGLQLGALEIYTAEDKTLLAAITAAEVSVQLMPILQRQIRVDGVRLDGLEVNYAVDAQGRTGWDGLSDPKPDGAPAEAASDTPAELSVDRIQITDLRLVYTDAQSGDRAEIRDFNLTASEVALAGRPFPLTLEFTAVWNEFSPLRLEWDGPVQLNLDTQILQVADAKIEAQAGAAKLALTLATDTHWGEPLTSKGAVKWAPFALPPLLEALGVEPPKTASAQALQKFGGTLSYNLGPDQLELKPINLTLDQTRLDGDLLLHDFAKPAITTTWRGSALVLDDYLPPPDKAAAGAPAETAAPPQPLPLETLRELNLNADVSFDQVSYQGLPVEQPQLRIKAKDGLLQLDRLSLQTADGKITGQGQLDARGSTARLQLGLQSQGVELGTLLRTFAEVDKLSGKATADLTATSHGATDQALTDNLVVEAKAQSDQLRVVPINIEEQFCRALALLQQQNLPENMDWPDMTRLEPVQMQLRYAENTLTVQQLNAEIAHLLGSATGSFNLETGQFNIPVSLSLGDFANAAAGCLPVDEKWRKRSLPIRCKGTVDDIGVKTCLPDTQVLTDLFKDRIKGEAREKLEEEKDRLEKKLGSKARDLLQEKLGEEKGKNTEDSVRGRLDQFRKRKDPKPAAPAAAEPAAPTAGESPAAPAADPQPPATPAAPEETKTE